MTSYPQNGERDELQNELISVSANEFLHDESAVTRLWPEDAAYNVDFLPQIERHNERTIALRDVLLAIPDPTMSLETAFQSGQVTPQQVEALYRNLTDLLTNPDSERLVLYLPFELLPVASWSPVDKDVQKSIEVFKIGYLTAWKKQLSVQDVRANFVDGDVLEEDQRASDLSRVVKAAHLIPQLIELGMIDYETITNLFETTTDLVLKRSIAEAIAVIENDISILDSISAPVELTTHEQLTQRRQDWLNEKESDRRITALATELSQEIIKQANRNEGQTAPLLTATDTTTQKILIEAIQTAIEQSSMDDSGNPQAIFDRFKSLLIDKWRTTTDPHIRERVSKLLRRSHKLGVVSSIELNELGIALPHLTGPLSKNLEQMPESIEKMKQIATSIETDPELSALIYPIISIGGSRLKGYGAETSDLDTGIFVRPTTSPLEGHKIRDLLHTYFEEVDLDDEPIEFWLEEDTHALYVRPIVDPEAVVADEYWTHILFGSPLIGNQREIHDMQKKLLRPYFYSPPHETYGRSDRALYLERMEQDLLQYRLMHKGYERHYPRVTQIDQIRTAPVDGQSMFWDAGYRRMATELFVDKVFLPKIS